MAPTNTFTISADPGTDIWRKPPTTDVFNAPTAVPPPGPHPQRTSGPLSAFLSARLSLNFKPQEQYDQGGLLLSFRPRSDNNNNNTTANKDAAPPPKWIKTGIELYNGAPRASTVGCDRWADWSVADLPVPSSSSPSAAAASPSGGGGETGWTTVAVEKDKDGNGTGLWVYRVVAAAEGSSSSGGGGGGGGEEEEKVPLREICWVFEAPEAWEVEVHAMAARPEKGATGALTVEFAGLEVKWAS